MNSITDYNIFNTINQDKLVPKAKKPLPFPLENFDQEIGSAYAHLDAILTKLKAAKSNPVNNTPAKKKRLNSLIYKTKTCLSLLKEVSAECEDLWY